MSEPITQPVNTLPVDSSPVSTDAVLTVKNADGSLVRVALSDIKSQFGTPNAGEVSYSDAATYPSGSVGAEVADLKSEITQSTRNIWNGKRNYDHSTQYRGVHYVVLPQSFPAGTYTLSYRIVSNATGATSLVGIYDTDLSSSYTNTHRIAYYASPRSARDSFTFTASAAFQRVMFCANTGASNSNGYNIDVYDIQLETGSTATAYIPPVTAEDFAAREFTPLQPTGDTTDRTREILLALNAHGSCVLGKGDFYTSGITMPDNTALKGQGDATKLYLLDSALDSAVIMGSCCTVSDLSIVGASEAITLDDDFVGIPIENTEAANVWADGDVSVPASPGWVHKVLQTPIQPGVYRLTAEVSTTNTYDSYVAFSTSTNGSINNTNIVAYATFSHSTRTSRFFVIPTTVYSVRLCSGDTIAHSDGYAATWANMRMTLVDSRCGIKWAGDSVVNGVVHNCRISKFNCAGIILQDTGTSTNHNLAVSDVFITGCNVGIYVRKNSEFNKFANCTLVGNYYGYLNRGGNNDISNSGIDSNIVNAQIDADEGSNNGHGLICGCSLNHADSNTGYSLIIKGTGRMLVTGCNFYYGKILFNGTNGNTLTGCGFGNSAPIEITNGQCNLIANCIIRSASDTPITLTSNTASKVVNCYTRDGDAVTPTTA